MAEQGLDGLLVTFINNACGYQAFAADLRVCMVLPREGDAALLVTALEKSGFRYVWE